MTHVVERCPSCGVEHDVSAASECEACGARLRLWCRVHGREMGWLAAPVCPRCAEEPVRAQAVRSPRAPNTAPSFPASSAQAHARPAATKDTGKRSGWRLHLHYLVKLTLFLTCFGAVAGAGMGALMGMPSGDVGAYEIMTFAQGGVVGGLCASVLGALTYAVEVLSGKRK